MRKDFLGYMHTLDGEPASFAPRDGGYLYYASHTGAELVKNLTTLRRQQALDAQSNASGKKPKYGYVRVYAARKDVV